MRLHGWAKRVAQVLFACVLTVLLAGVAEGAIYQSCKTRMSDAQATYYNGAYTACMAGSGDPYNTECGNATAMSGAAGFGGGSIVCEAPRP
jgi:hypothetical protein